MDATLTFSAEPLRAVDHAPADGDADGGGPIVHAQLREDVPQVHDDGVFRNPEGGSHFLVPHAAGDKLEDFDLARRERRMRRPLLQPGSYLGRNGPTARVNLP